MRSVLLPALALLLAMIAAPALAQRQGDLAAGITDEEVAVTSDYQGARLTVFGVHWRGGRAKSDVVVVLRGPGEEEIVRRKRRVLGLWINADPVRFSDAPSFHALASTRPIGSFLSASTIANLGLDPGARARLETATPADTDPAAYRRALVRLKRAEGLYRESPYGLRLEEDGAFKAPFIIPANAPIGAYSVDVFLFRNGRLVQQKPGEIVISRIGIEKTIHTAAHKWPLLYGIATVLFALGAGYAAALAFRRR
ncbi:MAG: TIGR02186 family protein [Hyphomonadaceae bacterium]|nr:TIGR02186 family protein [Hyphomonadaceae bacterium]